MRTGKSRDATPRLVAFAPGWEDTYPPPNPLGKPENYTHVILAFVTSYRWTTGARSRDEWPADGPPCSDSCQLYLSASWNTFPTPENPLSDFREAGPGFVKLVKQRNPSAKVLLSIGGWQQSNLGQANQERTRGTCKVHSGCRWSCRRRDGNLAQDQPFEYSDWQGRLTHTDQYECTGNAQDSVAPDDACLSLVGAPNEDALFEQLGARVAKIVSDCGADGVDFDIERTRDLTCSGCYPDVPCGGDKQLRFIELLAAKLRAKMPDAALITCSPLAPYVTGLPAAVARTTPSPNPYVGTLQHMVQQGTLDFVNVQFYNEPELNPFSRPAECLEWYDRLAGWLGGPQHLTFGMCSFVENGTCGECQSAGHVSCDNPASRIASIVKPLLAKYGSAFGGVMFWSTAGDQQGQFSGPIKEALAAAGPPDPVPEVPPGKGGGGGGGGKGKGGQQGECALTTVGIVLTVLGGVLLLVTMLLWGVALARRQRGRPSLS